MPEADSDSRHTASGIWLILGAGAIVSLLLLMWPFLLALATAALIAVLIHPIYEWCTERTNRPSLVSLLLTLFFTLVVFLPGLAILIALLSSLEASFYEGASRLADETWTKLVAHGTVQKVASVLGLQAGEIPAMLGDKLREQAGPIAGESLRLVSGFGGGLVDLGIVLFSLFFLLRDGRSLVQRLVWLSPLDRGRTLTLIGNARDAIFATVYGNIGVAIAQGVLGGLAFAVAGIASPVLWGVVMAFLSMAPLVGAAVVWLPAGIILLIQGEVLRGVLLLAFGAGVISSVDNFLRALIVGERTELHPLAVFLSVLGGIALFGAAGVFLGPVLFVVSVSMIEMTRAALDAEARPGGLLGTDPLESQLSTPNGIQD